MIGSKIATPRVEKEQQSYGTGKNELPEYIHKDVRINKTSDKARTKAAYQEAPQRPCRLPLEGAISEGAMSTGDFGVFASK